MNEIGDQGKGGRGKTSADGVRAGTTGEKNKASESLDSSRASTAPPSELKAIALKIKQTYPSIAQKRELIAWLGKDPQNYYKFAMSYYIQDLTTLRVPVLPPIDWPTGQDCHVARDTRSMVTSIHVGTESLTGRVLDRLVINFGAHLRGNTLVIYESGSGDDKNKGGLVVPVMNLEDYREEVTMASGQKHTVEGKKMILQSQTTTLVLRKTDVDGLIGLTNLKMTMIPGVLRELSKVLKYDPNYDISNMTDLANVSAERARPDLKSNHTAFLNSLEAAFLATATTEQKITAFESNPSFQFLAKLKIKRPFSRQLLDAGGKQAKMVPLSSLSGDAKILVQDLPFDPNYYDKRLNSSISVYIPGDYRVRAGKGLRVLGEVPTMTAGELRRIIAAKERSSTLGTAGGTTSQPGTPASGGSKEIDIEI